jgi:oligo-alginate lyase
MKFRYILIIFTLLISYSFAQTAHPNLVITGKGVESIKENLGNVPLFDKSYTEVKAKLDKTIALRQDVPLPKDPGGGYTHEKHKQNYNDMHSAGILYQVTGEDKYAEFIKSMLYKYAELYPSLGHHPQAKDQTPGRLFWQSLNECVWLLHTIQAYDCIYDWLEAKDRKVFEEKIFLPMTAFFTEELHHEFDLIHNHGTWMVASVGMTGMVLNNKELIEKSLYGSDKTGKGGFLAQLNLLFSPDGYYTEGGYYVRYALWPFFIFAEAIQNNLPDIGVYEFRDQILKKAFYSALQMTYTNGEFMPINDALKEKTFLSTELVYALNFVYERYGRDEQLLSIAKRQNRVTLTDGGIIVAKDLAEIDNPASFNWKSVEYCDGPEGNQGGVGILRWGPEKDMETLLFKYSAHGLSHGHYDKMTFLFYDQGREIIQDYGAARFLNVEQKQGGRYLPENKTFALQTIAHNTLIVDEKSHYDGNQEISQQNSPQKYFFNSSNPALQYVSAKDNSAYEGVEMHRTMAMVNDENLIRPLVVDIFKIKSDKEHQYDLPYYYMGHFISTNFEYTPYTNERKQLGKANGYQHLWKTAEGKSDKSAAFTWLNGERYYSIISNTDSNTDILFTQIGAADPEFNLRNEEGILFRTRRKDHVFVSVIEPHGDFNPTIEYSFNSYSAVENIKVLQNDDEITAAEISGKKDLRWLVFVINNDADEAEEHTYSYEGKEYKWKGPFFIYKIKES